MIFRGCELESGARVHDVGPFPGLHVLEAVENHAASWPEKIWAFPLRAPIFKRLF